MTFYLRKVLSSVLVILLMLNALPAGLPWAASGAVARAEALEEAAVPDAPSEAPAPPEASEAPEEPAAPEETTAPEETAAPEETVAPEPSDAPDQTSAPDGDESSQQSSEADQAAEPQPSADAARAAGLTAKATPVVTALVVCEQSDPTHQPLPTASIPLNTGMSHELRLRAQMTYNVDGVSADVKWTTSNAKVATISYDGAECTVTGVGAGTAKITATAQDGSGKSDYCNVTVAWQVEDVAITGASHSVVQGFTLALGATVLPTNAANKSLAWDSDAKDVATVDGKGVVKGVLSGVATISATAKDGSGNSDTWSVTVLPQAGRVLLSADGEAASAGTIDLHTAKKTIVLTAAVDPSDAMQTVTWSTTNKKIAAISASGNQCTVTGVGLGAATVTATATDGSKKSAPFAVTVTRLSNQVAISGPSDVLLGGRSMTLTATVMPTTTTNKAVSWSPSDENVATVSKGVVTAKKIEHPQSVTITATAADGSGAFGTYDLLVNPAAATVTVQPEGGASAVIDLNEALAADRTLRLNATVAPEDAADDVTWSTNNKKVATVDASGLVTGVAVGQAVITATAKDGSKTYGPLTVTVTRLSNQVAISAPSDALLGGLSMTLTATVTPTNTTNKAVDWLSSDPGAARITSKGVMTAEKIEHPQTVTITAMAADGSGAFDTYDILIKPAAATVTVQAEGGAPAVIDLNEALAADRTLQLTASVAPEDAEDGVTWSTSNKKIATVDAAGLVTGVAVGQAVITATAKDGGKTYGTLTVNVVRLSSGVTITGAKTLLGGASLTLTATVTPSATTNKAVTWTSSDDGVATVSATGVVTAKKIETPDSVTITATAKDNPLTVGTYDIDVTPAAATVTVTAEGGAPEIDLNETDRTLQLTATVAPEDAKDDVTWSTSNKKIATVSASGLVTGASVGQAVITATAADGSKVPGSLTVNVVARAKSVAISGSSAMVGGKSVTLTATVGPALTTNKRVAWSSSDEGVATVSATGVVTALRLDAEADVTITATTLDGSDVPGTWTIHVTPPPETVKLRTANASPAVIDMNEALAADRTLQLAYTVTLEDAVDTVTWTSSSSKIATVSASGLVTGVKVGQAVITARTTDNKAYGTISVSVVSLSKGVTVTGSQSLLGGASLTLTATVTPSATTNKAVTWTSSDDGIAIVSATGVVTAKKIESPQFVTITATAADHPGVSGYHVIQVTPAAATVAVTAEGGSNQIEAGKALKLYAVISPAAAGQGVIWSTNNNKVATVSAKGLVTGVGVGQAVITATANDGSKVPGSLTVNVVRLVTGVTVSGAQRLVGGKSTQLTATVVPSNATKKAVLWSTGNPAIATVSTSGLVTAQNIDEPKDVTITATATDGSGFSGSLILSVVPAASGITILYGGEEPESVLLNLNAASKTAQLTAQVEPTGSAASVTWSSSNPKAATVTSGLVTGVGAGTATVTATAADGSGQSDTCLVSVDYRATDILVTGVDEVVSGSTAQMAKSVTPLNTTNKAVTWSISDDTLATISPAGLLTALDVGVPTDVTVTAVAADGSGVTGTKVVSILPMPQSVAIFRGGESVDRATAYLTIPTLQLSAVVGPQGARQGVTWSSSDTAVATVDATGRVTALSVGATVITATASGTSVSKELTLTVKERPNPVAIQSITPDPPLTVVGRPITWTLSAQGDGNITYGAQVFKDGAMVDAHPSVIGNKVSYTPTASGAYQLSATASNNYGDSATLSGGDVTAHQLMFTRTAGDIELGGQVTSGAFGTFGPTEALPEGFRFEYSLSGKQGTAAALNIGSTTGSVCQIEYLEAAIGTATYDLNYTAYQGQTALFTDKVTLSCQVIAETDLPASILLAHSSYEGEVGVPITIPLSDLTPNGGSLLAKDFAWSVWDGDGEARLAEGLSAQFDQPGSHSLTLRGVYNGTSYDIPVEFVVTKTLQFANDIRISQVHPGGKQVQYVGHAWLTDGGQLSAGERYTWTLRRTAGESVDLIIEDDGSNVDFAKLVMTSFDSVTQAEQNDFVLTCTVNAYIKGELAFSITNSPDPLSGLPTGIACERDSYTIPVGGTVTFGPSTIDGVGAELPNGAWFDAFDVNWDVCTYVINPDRSFSVTFNQPGRYVIQAAAGYQGYMWTTDDILVTVGDGANPDFRLDVYQRSKTIYLDAGVEDGFLADLHVHDAELLDGEEAEWTITPVTDGPLPVTMELIEQGNDHATVIYTDPEAEGESTYLVTYDAGPYHWKDQITARVVAETPEGMPTGVGYPETEIHLNPGDSHDFDTTDVFFTGGTVGLEDSWFDIWTPDSIEDDAIEWDGEVCTVTFEDPGRYFVKAAGGFANYEFTFPIVVTVGTEDEVLSLSTTQLFDQVFLHHDETRVARIRVDNFDLKDGEEFNWSVEPVDPDSETDWGWMEIEDKDPEEVDVLYNPGDALGTASFRVTLEAGGYTASQVIDVDVITAPDTMPTGISCPYELTYPLPVGGSKTFDPSLLDFAEGTVPDGYEMWTAIDLAEGNWGEVDDEPQDGREVWYGFYAPGRYVLTAKVGILNYVWQQDIELVVTDTGTLDPGLTFDQRFDTAYPGGELDGFLGELRAQDAVIRYRSDRDEGFHWSLEMRDDSDSGVAALDLGEGDAQENWLHYQLLGEQGTVHFRFHYDAVDGLYQGETEWFALTVEPTPANLPTELLLTTDHYKLHPGDSLDLDNADIGYDETLYQVPDGAEFSYSPNNGDWDQVRFDWYDNGFHLDFSDNAFGYYTVAAKLSLGNITVSRDITVLVADSFPQEAELTLDQRYATAYLDGDSKSLLGYVSVGVNVCEDMEVGYKWTVTPLTEGAEDIADVRVSEDESSIRGATLVMYLGGGTGPVSYKVDYEAMEGLYKGSVQVDLTVAAELPPNLPTAIAYQDPVIETNPYQSVDFEASGVTPVNGEIPAGVKPRINFQYKEGDFEWVQSEWNEDHTTWSVTFPRGVYIIDAELGVGNYTLSCDIEVRAVVSGTHLNPGLVFGPRYSVAWLDGRDEDYVGSVFTSNATLPDGGDYHWDIEPLSGDQVADMYLNLDAQSKDQVPVHFHLNGIEGTAKYKVTYTALDGTYQGWCYVSIEAKAGHPDTLPTGIGYAKQADIRLKTDDSYSFDLVNDIIVSGSLPSDRLVWRDLWTEGDWGSVQTSSEDWNKDRTYTFTQPGRYTAKLALGVENFIWTKDLSFTVLDEGQTTLDAGLVAYHRDGPMYLDGEEPAWCCDVYADGASLTEDEARQAQWSVDVDEGGGVVEIDPQEMDWDVRGRHVVAQLKGNPGHVKYTIHYSALDGLYRDSLTLEFDVANPIDPRPDGIEYLGGDSIPAVPGEPVTIDLNDITFTGDQFPQGTALWYDIWTQDGAWDSVDQQSSEDNMVRTFTFEKEGQYFMLLVAGAGNYEYELPVTVTVLEEGNNHTGVTFYPYLPITVLYTDGDEEGWLGDVYVEDVTLTEEQQEDASWTLTREGSESEVAAQIELEINEENLNSRQINYILEGGTGHVKYRLDYSAAGGLYQGTTYIEFNVQYAPPNLPTGMTLGQVSFDTPVGGSVTFTQENMQFSGGTIPENANFWWRLNNEMGDWDRVDEDWNASGTARTNTFYEPGRYVVGYDAGIGNHHYYRQAVVTVGAGGGLTLDPGLHWEKRTDVLYTGGDQTEGYLGDVYADGATLTDAEKADTTWDLELVSGGTIAEVSLEINGENLNSRQLNFRLLEGAGPVEYLLHYSAADGLYVGSIPIHVNVLEDPGNLPDGITYPESHIEAEPGEPVDLNLDDIQFTGGQLPANEVGVWRQIWNDQGDWDGVSEDWNEGETIRTNTFYREGRYLVYMAAGVGNREFKVPVTITVLEDGHTLDADLRYYGRSATLYAGDEGHTQGYLGSGRAEGAVLTEDEQVDVNWWVTQSEGETVATLTATADEGDPASCHVEYELTGVPGSVKCVLHYSALEGLYEDEVPIEFTVLSNPGGLPEGISYSGETAYDIQPGGSAHFDLDDIEFTGGSFPEGADVWRQLWKDYGDWEGVQERWNDGETVCDMTFYQEGRYILTLAAGVGNYEYHLEVSVTVREGEDTYFDPGFSKFQRYDVAYLDGSWHDWLSDIYADCAALTEAERQAAQWDIVQEEGDDVAEVSFEAMDWSDKGRHMEYTLKGETGHARWKVSYSAADGLYQGDIYVDLEVRSELAGLPSGITCSYASPIVIHPGDQLHLDKNQVQFTSDGEIPSNATVWRDIWNDQGDWGSVDEEWNDGDTVRTNTFNDAGRYFLTMAAAINNHVYTQQLEIQVLPEGQTSLDAGFQVFQNYDTAYVGVGEGDWLADIYANGAALTDQERKDAIWGFVQLTGQGAATVTCNPMSWSDNGRHLEYHLTGGTGEVTCKIIYSAADELYQDEVFVHLTVTDAPEWLPTGIAYDGEVELEAHPGRTLTLDMNQLHLTGGDIPQNVTPWKNVSYINGNWGSVNSEWRENQTKYAMTFSQEGRFLLSLTAGVGNRAFAVPVAVTVLPEGQDHLNVEFGQHMQYDDFYVDGSRQQGWLAFVSPSTDVVLTDAERQAVSWDVTQTEGEGENVARVTRVTQDVDPTVLRLDYELLGSVGHVSCDITYSAAGGKYRGTTTVEFDVQPALTGLPTGITYPDTELTAHVGVGLPMDLSAIELEGEVPDGATLWTDCWSGLGNWSGVTDHWDDAHTIRTLTFSSVGSYTVNMMAGVGNYEWCASVSVIVLPEGEDHLNVELGTSLIGDILYTNGQQQDWLALVSPSNVVLTDAQKQAVSWTVTQTEGEGEGVARVARFNADADPSVLWLHYELLGGTGHVSCDITYSAADGKFLGTTTVEFDVESDLADPPTGITYPETELTARVGEGLPIDLSAIQIANGALPDGATLQTYCSNGEGDWNSVQDQWNEARTVRTLTFSRVGGYSVNLTARVGNFEWHTAVTIAVLPAGQDHLDVEFGTSLSSDILYTDGQQQGWLAFVTPSNVTLTDAQQWAIVWTVEQLSGQEIVSVTRGTEGVEPNALRLDYQLLAGGGTGQVNCKVTYSAAGGAYRGETTVNFEVAAQSGLPTGISLSQTSYTIEPGETLYFQRSDIGFAGGAAPAGAAVSKGYQKAEGDWTQADWAESGSELAITFPQAGRWFLNASIGFASLSFQQPIEVVVQDAESAALSIRVIKHFYPAVYSGGAEDSCLATVEANAFALAEGEQCEWSMWRIDTNPGAPLLMYVDSTLRDYYRGPEKGYVYFANVIGGLTSGEAGEVTYRIRLKVGDRTAYADLTAPVVTTRPENPVTEGFSCSREECWITAGNSLTFNYSDIRYSGDPLPEGYEIWREYWLGDEQEYSNSLNWNQVDCHWTEDGLTCAFPKPGLYTLRAEAGFGDIHCFGQSIRVYVRDKTNHIPVSLYVNQTTQTLYEDGSAEGSLGFIATSGIKLRQHDRGYWNIERIDGNETSPVDVTTDSGDPYIAWLDYHLLGGTGTARFRMTYAAELDEDNGGSLYLGSCEFSVTVAPSAPSSMPTGIQTPYQDLYVVGEGQTLSFDADLLSFESGATPAGTRVYRQFRCLEGDWFYGSNRQHWDHDKLSVYFGTDGHYTLTAVIGIGNAVRYTKDIMIIATKNGYPNDVSLVPDALAEAVSSEGDSEGNLEGTWGTVAVDPAIVPNAGESAGWWIERIDGTGDAPVELEFDSTDETQATIHYKLLGGTGTVRYRVTMGTSCGQYGGQCEITMTVY